jgi:hypothetical protein
VTFLAETGSTSPDMVFGFLLVALGIVTLVGGAFAWRRRET